MLDASVQAFRTFHREQSQRCLAHDDFGGSEYDLGYVACD